MSNSPRNQMFNQPINTTPVKGVSMERLMTGTEDPLSVMKNVEEVKRRLLETTDPINKIMGDVFQYRNKALGSKQFSKSVGISASVYRRRYSKECTLMKNREVVFNTKLRSTSFATQRFSLCFDVIKEMTLKSIEVRLPCGGITVFSENMLKSLLPSVKIGANGDKVESSFIYLNGGEGGIYKLVMRHRINNMHLDEPFVTLNNFVTGETPRAVITTVMDITGHSLLSNK